MKRLFFALVLLTAATPHLNAQTANSDSTHQLHYNAGLTGAYLKGNIVQTRLAANAGAFYKEAHNDYSLQEIFTYNYLKDFGTEKQSDLMSQTIFRYRPGHRVYPIGILWLQNTRLLNYNGVAAGAGAEWVAVNTPAFYFVPSVLAWQEWNRFGSTSFNYDAYDGLKQVNTPRVSLRLYGRCAFTPVKIGLDYTIYAMQSLRWSDNYRIYANAALSLPVYKGLAAQIGYLYTYEALVVANRKQADGALTFGVSYTGGAIKR